MNITRLRAQIRAGRELLGLKQGDIAQKMGVSLSKISRAESGDSKGVDTLLEIQQFLLRSGIELTEDGGVRPRQSRVEIFQGPEGFIDFYNDIYEVASTHPNPDICVTSADESEFIRWLGSFADVHIDRMNRLKSNKNFSFRILLKILDSDVPGSSYARYRWVPEDQFANVCIYIYGDKTGFVEFLEESVIVTVTDNPSITSAIRTMFQTTWSISATSPR